MCVRDPVDARLWEQGCHWRKGACILDLLILGSRTSQLSLIRSLSVLLVLHRPASVPLKHPHTLTSLQH